MTAITATDLSGSTALPLDIPLSAPTTIGSIVDVSIPVTIRNTIDEGAIHSRVLYAEMS